MGVWEAGEHLRSFVTFFPCVFILRWLRWMGQISCIECFSISEVSTPLAWIILPYFSLLVSFLFLLSNFI